MNESADKAAKATDVVTPVNGGGKRVEYKPAPKKQEKITCSKSTALLLFLIAVACVILSSFVTFWITKGIYDHSMEIKPLIDEAALESYALCFLQFILSIIYSQQETTLYANIAS
uniref:Transmembrane protein n=1 Tax=Ascaris lumbricoides TaxID=6252 RepID=A0A0M3IRI6_ASCLU